MLSNHLQFGFFVFWFGIGALIAMLTSFFISNFFVQSLLFILSSAILLFLTKPFVNKITSKNITIPTNIYSIVGKEGLVVEKISNLESIGKVKINGELWSAISDDIIEKDSKIKVLSVDGVKLKVEKCHN